MMRMFVAAFLLFRLADGVAGGFGRRLGRGIIARTAAARDPRGVQRSVLPSAARRLRCASRTAAAEGASAEAR